MNHLHLDLHETTERDQILAQMIEDLDADDDDASELRLIAEAELTTRH